MIVYYPYIYALLYNISLRVHFKNVKNRTLSERHLVLNMTEGMSSNDP